MTGLERKMHLKTKYLFIGNDSIFAASSPVLHKMMFKVHQLVSDPYKNMNSI